MGVYKPTQASEHVVPFIKFTPEWFIDCGPGSGVESLAVRQKWPNVRVLALEPSPIGFRAAMENLPVDDSSFRLMEAAIWSHDCELRLQKFDELLHSTFFHGNPEGETIPVKARSLDSLDVEFGPLENVLLWMDIEGSERKALEGAHNLLKRRAIKAINLELNSLTEVEAHGMLRNNGFQHVRTYLDQGHGGSKDEIWELVV